MTAIKKNDFIEVDYTGRLKESGEVFDTNSVIVCVGQSQIVGGIDNYLVGKESGKEYTIELMPENAFGKKDASLIQLIPTKKFVQQGINPVNGLQVNIDGIIGTIKSSGSGRILVDFNHPLAGKGVVYTVKVKRLIEDEKEKILGFLKTALNISDEQINVELNEGRAVLGLHQKLPKEFESELAGKLKEIINGLKDIVFTEQKKK